MIIGKCPVCGADMRVGSDMTNADRIRAMTDEELANLFATSDCHECILDWHDACKSANGECGRERVLYWLKQEASE